MPLPTKVFASSSGRRLGRDAQLPVGSNNISIYGAGELKAGNAMAPFEDNGETCTELIDDLLTLFAS